MPAIGLRACYAMPGTNRAYAAMWEERVTGTELACESGYVCTDACVRTRTLVLSHGYTCVLPRWY
eukprot:2249951-Rhodomonas_salina.3